MHVALNNSENMLKICNDENNNFWKRNKSSVQFVKGDESWTPVSTFVSLFQVSENNMGVSLTPSDLLDTVLHQTPLHDKQNSFHYDISLYLYAFYGVVLYYQTTQPLDLSVPRHFHLLSSLSP